MKKLLLTGIAFGAVLAFSGMANAQIKLGVAGPITGPNAAFGAQLKNGVEQAVGHQRQGRRDGPEDHRIRR